jgi:hypothetical protein
VTDPTEPGVPVNDLLTHNIETMRAYVERLINASHLTVPASGNAPTQGSPETGLSVQEPPAEGQRVR